MLFSASAHRDEVVVLYVARQFGGPQIGQPAMSSAPKMSAAVEQIRQAMGRSGADRSVDFPKFMSADLNPLKRTVLDIAADLANGRTSGRGLVEAALAQITYSAGEGASELGQRVENRSVMVPPG